MSFSCPQNPLMFIVVITVLQENCCCCLIVIESWMFSSYRELVFNLLSIRKLSLPRLSRLYLVWCVISVSCHGKVQTSFSSSQQKQRFKSTNERPKQEQQQQHNNENTNRVIKTRSFSRCHHFLSSSFVCFYVFVSGFVLRNMLQKRKMSFHTLVLCFLTHIDH